MTTRKRTIFPRATVPTMMALALLGAARSPAAEPSLLPTDPPSLSIRTEGAGSLQRLTFAPVELRDGLLQGNKARIPMNYHADGAGWNSWKQKNPPLSLKPEVDTLVLGELYRQVLPASVSVSSADEKTVFQRGRDYLIHDDTGQVINLENGLGAPGSGLLRVTFRYATQRIDLVQADATGRLSVKQGEAAVVCPMIPQPDEGQRPVAGVFISPYEVSQGRETALLAEHILPIRPVEPTRPIQPQAVSRTREKLSRGEPVSIAFVGDSITLGAEAGPWWSDRSKTYTGRFVAGLQRRYPRATIREISAYEGGGTAVQGLELFESKVKPARPDLLLIALGINDATGGRGPRNPPESFKGHLRSMIDQAREGGADVLLVTSLVPCRMSAADRIGRYRQVMLELADELKVGCADVQSDWINLVHRGIPPCTQLHNCSNHPGAFGMTVYADNLLRFFDETVPAEDARQP